MDTNKTPVDEAFLDAAAMQAVGAHTAAEAEAFKTRLAAGSAEEQRVAAELETVVAKMAGASPYMEPGEALRGKILQATAPQSFKYDEYRKSNDMARWQRWGLIAAVLFLVVGASYNMMLQSAVKERDGRLGEAVARLNQQQLEISERNKVLAMAMHPDTKRRDIVQAEGTKVVGALLENQTLNTSYLVLPNTVIPPGTTAKIVYTDKNGERKEILAGAVGAVGNRSYLNGFQPHAGPLDITAGDGTPAKFTILP